MRPTRRLILGVGALFLIAEGQAMRRRPFVQIESDEARARKLIERGWTTLVGDATVEEVLKSAGLARAVTVLPAPPSDAGNVFITLIARSEKPGITIIARAETDSACSKLHKGGEIVPRPADDLLLHPGDHIATVSAPRPAPGGEARAPG